ncbi:MAG TPA: hypothetical protein VMV69_21760 [Pirellulales bacterium]|nr:hypothetical protein [Pirellulales bacterium]
MSDSSAPRPAPVEELVAYLDGELGADESRHIERLLADDPRVRVELKRLDQTWELLDGLPRAAVEPNFTRSTVEMIAVNVADEIEHERVREPWHRRRAWWFGSGCVLAAALAGVFAGDKIASYPNERLLDELTVLEHLEAYRQTPRLEFLREAQAEKLFALGQPVAGKSFATETPAARRERTERMDPRDKEQVVRKQRAFADLSQAEQARLRRLDLELRQAPDAQELARVLDAFQTWLNQLTAAERAHLLHLPDPGQRLKAISQKRAEEAARLGPEDAQEFERWGEELFKRRLKPGERQRLDGLSAEERFERLQTRLRQAAAQGQPEWRKLPLPREWDRLRERLSDKAKAQMDRAVSERAKRQLLRIWIQDGFHLRPASRAAATNGVELSDEQLREQFRQLPDIDQNRLLGRPPEEMFRALRMRYEKALGVRR